MAPYNEASPLVGNGAKPRPRWRDEICLYLFLGLGMVLLVITFVSTLLNGSRIEDLSWEKRDDLDSCTWRKKQKDEILGGGDSLFGPTNELEQFFTQVKYDQMVKLVSNLCASKACRDNDDCAHTACPAIWRVVDSVDNSSSSSGDGEGVRKNGGGKFYSMDLGSKTSGNGQECDLARLQQPFPPFLSQGIFVCVAPPNVQALFYRCLPLFSQVCYAAESKRIRSFCQAVNDAYGAGQPPWGPIP
jgi:hypothetical protein